MNEVRAGLPGWPPPGPWPSGRSLGKPGARSLEEADRDSPPAVACGRAKQDQEADQSTAAEEKNQKLP
ncbi:hypothetical protein GA8_18555 [Geobacillus sp. A8]|nr:hypothetical protein GA8_18555 [Geobacillus sp. A8]